jgi:hypothetical protein
MPDDVIQGALFGSLDDEPADADVPARNELRVCALNINNPNLQRAQQTLAWLLASRSNVLVLTELKPSDGAKLVISGLAAEGFEVCLPPGWAGGSYFTVVATRGLTQTPVAGPGDPRAVAVDVEHDGEQIRIIGLYGPTNGMTTDSSDRRRTFQKTFSTPPTAPGSCWPAISTLSNLATSRPWTPSKNTTTPSTPTCSEWAWPTPSAKRTPIRASTAGSATAMAPSAWTTCSRPRPQERW